jgi:oxygen-independent coproporphyrinogen-3 oxidase
MWPYHPDLLARPVPRYTSYPTAVEFTEAVGEDHLREALNAVAHDQPLSLYVHIPFCKEICWYCGCNTGRANRSQRLSSYLDALHSEIQMVAGLLGGRGKVAHIAFGGGSPNAISPIEFTRLVDALMVRFHSERPTLSVELDPRSLATDWDITLKTTGVSRVSLGVQTFDPAIQAAIGRVQPHDLIAETVDRLRTASIGSINFDLMYGLPGQNRETLAVTLDQTVALAPERIALFGYAHVPHLLPRQKQVRSDDLPDQAERFAMAALGYEQLTAAGYVAVGFDHFAKPGDWLARAAEAGQVHRNFQGFTDDGNDILIGFGASAISQFPDRIVQNEKHSGRYRMLCSGHRLPATRGVVRDADDRARAAIIEALLCRGEADISSLGVFVPSPDQLHPFYEAVLACSSGKRLIITPEGRPYSRTIAALFDRYRTNSAQRFSTAI